MVEIIECDPPGLLARGGGWLAAEPILHNVVYSVTQRAADAPAVRPDDRWFLLEETGQPLGAAILTPPFPLGITPMSDRPLVCLVEFLAERAPRLGGVSGPGDVAARFAKRWRQRTGADVEAGMAQLMYRLDAVVPPPPAAGMVRPAERGDRTRLCEWFAAFCDEAGAPLGDIPTVVDRRLADGALYVWEHTTAVAMAGVATPVAGVVRVGPVYTPPARRGRGYATSCVAAVSQHALDNGATACMLYTDAANPTSNAIYQRIGYRPVATAAEYRFRYR